MLSRHFNSTRKIVRQGAGLGAIIWLVAGPAAVAQPNVGQDRSPQREYCTRLEAQLASLDRGGGDARGEQIRRAEEAVHRQQVELDRMVAHSRRLGCERTGFFLFGGGQPPQCDRLTPQIQRLRDNLDRLIATIQQLRGGDSDRGERRQAILIALAQNGCGPQYQASIPQQRPRGLFETLFGGAGSPSGSPYPGVAMPDEMPNSSAFRTVCVRKCDGSFFPISYSTTQARFPEDERACQRACPATDVELYYYHNQGEDIGQATSVSGRPYSELPNAFRFRQEYNASCSCKRPGESWAAAVGEDPTVERGDIVVTDETAKAMSRPKPPASSRPERQPRRNSSSTRPPAGAPQSGPTAAARGANPSAPLPPPPADAQPPRAVGAQFISPR